MSRENHEANAPHIGLKLWREGCGSWACSECAKVLGRELRKRLQPRLRNERVILITFTIDRKRFESPRHAYDHIKRSRAIPRAVASFCAEAGIDHQGTWISKMELQSAGWPHWHILLIVPEELKIPQKGAFDEHWTWGFSNVRQGRKGGVSYFTKYVVKPADSPEEDRQRLADSGLPAKGVRWITAARGFWGGGRPEPKEKAKEGGGEESTEERVDEDEGKGIEERVAICDTRVTVLMVIDDDVRVVRVEASYSGMLSLLQLAGFWFSPAEEHAGFWYGDWADVQALWWLLGEAA